MGYLERAVSSDEQILYRAKIHWAVYVLPVLFIPLYGVGLIFLLFAWVYVISTDLAVTNKRVIGKWGLISRNTIEQRLEKIETIKVHQSIDGRLLNYGTIIVTGTGGSGTPISNIADPLAFREAVNSAMDALRNAPQGASPRGENDAGPRERLQVLEGLRRDGLMSDDEYAAKRAEIIAKL